MSNLTNSIRVFTGLKLVSCSFAQSQTALGAWVHSAACSAHPCPWSARAMAVPGSTVHPQVCARHWKSHTATNHCWFLQQGWFVGPVLQLGYCLCSRHSVGRGLDLEILLGLLIMGLHSSFRLISAFFEVLKKLLFWEKITWQLEKNITHNYR